jgi:hypothetical protein
MVANGGELGPVIGKLQALVAPVHLQWKELVQLRPAGGIRWLSRDG